MIVVTLFSDPNFYMNGKFFTQNIGIFTYNAAISMQQSEHLYNQIQLLAYKTHEIGFIFSFCGSF